MAVIITPCGSFYTVDSGAHFCYVQVNFHYASLTPYFFDKHRVIGFNSFSEPGMCTKCETVFCSLLAYGAAAPQQGVIGLVTLLHPGEFFEIETVVP